MQRFPRTCWGLWRKALAVVVAAYSIAHLSCVSPVGPTVVDGNALFSVQGNLLTATNSPGTIHNWQSFLIGQGEITKFIQQSSTSAVFNRIVGRDLSSISELPQNRPSLGPRQTLEKGASHAAAL